MKGREIESAESVSLQGQLGPKASVLAAVREDKATLLHPVVFCLQHRMPSARRLAHGGGKMRAFTTLRFL